MTQSGIEPDLPISGRIKASILPLSDGHVSVATVTGLKFWMEIRFQGGSITSIGGHTILHSAFSVTFWFH